MPQPLGQPLPETMQAVVCHGPNDYRLEVLPVPAAGPGEALMRVEAVGICASDLKCYHGAAKFWGDETRPAYAEQGAVPGHEFVGRVVTIDDEAAARWGVTVGDRVVSEQIVPCWQCRYCRRGQYWLCEPHVVYGFKRQRPGGMASYMVIPADAITYKIATSLEPAHAAFTEPLACGLHAVERADIHFDDVVVVAGCGPIGLSMVAGVAAKSPKAVLALDMSSTRLAIARLCGATRTIDITQEDPVEAVKTLTGGLGADVYLEATGHPGAVLQGLNILRKRGTFVEYGVFGSDVTADWSIISDDKELTIRGAHLGPHCWPTAIKMLESGRLPMERICTHQLPLEEFQRGLDLVGDGTRSIKVTLIPA
jgi:threonine dehydrogenase-like Zn-dependent dehydrogenase